MVLWLEVIKIASDENVDILISASSTFAPELGSSISGPQVPVPEEFQILIFGQLVAVTAVQKLPFVLER